MATRLMDQLNGNKNLLRVDGQLSSANDSELQQIAQSQGQLLPTSPLAAQMMGASKDSAKMAGTAAQKKAATSINVAGTPNLQTVQRTESARTERTAPEQAQYMKSQELMESGSIGDSIQKLVQSYIPQQAAQIAGTVPKYQLDVAALPTLTPEQKAALDGLLANPTKEAAAAIMPLLQGTGIVNPLSLIKPVSSIEASAAEIAKQMQPTTMAQVLQQPGTTVNPQQLADMLGMTVAQVQGMTVEDFQKQIQKIETQEFDKTEELRDIVTSPDTSFSEKEQARRQLRDMGASGVVATEADVERLNDTIQSADEIQIGSESVPLKDFLTSDKFSSIIKEYVEGTPEQQAKLGAQLGPEFVQFINDHKTALEEAASSLNATQKSATDTMAANKDLAKVKDGSSFSKGFMDKILPGWDGNFGEALQKPTILKTMDLMDEKQAGDFKIALEKASPTALEKLKGMTLQQLQAEGLLDPAKLNKYIASTQLLDTMNALNPDNPEQAAQITNTILQNLGMSAEEVNKQLAIAKETGAQTELSKKLDVNKDGKLDDPAALKNIETWDAFVGDDKSLTDTHDELFTKLEPFMADGTLSAEDMDKVFEVPARKTNDPTGFAEEQAARAANGATLEKMLSSKSPAAIEYVKNDPYKASKLVASQTLTPMFSKSGVAPTDQTILTYTNEDFAKMQAEIDRVKKAYPEMAPAMAYYQGQVDGLKSWREKKQIQFYLPRLGKIDSKEFYVLSKAGKDARITDPWRQFLYSSIHKTRPYGTGTPEDFFNSPSGTKWLQKAQRDYIKQNLIKN